MNEPSAPGARNLRLGGAAVLAIALLSGCSSASGIQADPAARSAVASVASIPTTTAASTGLTPAASAPAAVNGPLIRADTTNEEVERYLAAWGACLKKQGVPGITQQNSSKPDVTRFAKYPKAMAVCASKRPEQVTERYKREHPRAFQTQLRQFIKCMKDAGQKIIFIPPDGWGVSDEQAQSGYVPSQRAWTKCESKAYGG